MLAIFNHGNLVWPYILWFLLLSYESATLEGQPKVSQLTFPPNWEGSNTPWEQWWANWRISTFDLYPGGEGHGVQGQICDILRPQLAMNRFLPLWPHRFPHFGCINLGGWGGSDIGSMSSIRPICKSWCSPLLERALSWSHLHSLLLTNFLTHFKRLSIIIYFIKYNREQQF